MVLIERVGSPEEIRFGSTPNRVPTWDQLGVPTPHSAWMDTTLQTSAKDLIGPGNIGRLEFYSPRISIATLTNKLGVDPSDSTYREWTGFVPIPHDNGVADKVRYQSALMHNAKALLSDWDFIGADPPSIDGENAVTHCNIKGEVSTNLGDGMFYRPLERDPSVYTDPASGWNSPRGAAYLRQLDGTPAGGDGFLYWEPTSYVNFETHGPERSSTAYLEHLVDTYGSEHMFTSPETSTFLVDSDTRSYGRVRFKTRPDDPYCITYVSYVHDFFFRYNRSGPNSIGEQWWSGTVELFIDWSFSPTSINVDTEVSFSSLATCTFRWNCTRNFYGWRAYAPGATPGPWGYYDRPGDTSYQYEYTDKVYLATAPINLRYGEDTGVPALYDTDLPSLERVNGPDSEYSFRKFRDAVAHEMTNIYPAVFYSSKDAVESHLERLEANHIENLTQLGSVRDLITPVKGFSKLASAVLRKKPVDTVLAVLDLLTDAQLLWSYGIAPTIGDAEEIVDRVVPVADVYKSGFVYQTHTFNGRFDFDLPDQAVSPFTGCHLTARSKVRGQVNPNSLLAALLPWEAFGLLPTLSRLWDLVPFSFIVDWFANIGQRLEDFDTVVKILAMDITYSVHSTDVSWVVPDEALSFVNLTKNSSDVRMNYYVRSVMHRVPTVAFSEIDFREAGGIPDWKVAASLVYKFFRD